MASVTSRQIHDINEELRDCAESCQQALLIIQEEYEGMDLERWSAETMKNHARAVDSLLEPLRIDIAQLPLLEGPASVVVAATRRRLAYAHQWNDTLFTRVREWGKHWPDGCGARFRAVLERFQRVDAEAWGPGIVWEEIG